MYFDFDCTSEKKNVREFAFAFQYFDTQGICFSLNFELKTNRHFTFLFKRTKKELF